ncbi:MAG: hypothetical protein CL910_01615 [Deltaproteobacteria bacterium]|nr:hypothetical protein [Deltaproteobacteria bacterium]
MTHRLRLVFEDPDAFRREYERNMNAGGAFVHTELEPELREFVEVEISLAFCQKNLVLEAEVVHAAPGGVAVQFLEDAVALRRRFDEALADLSGPGTSADCTAPDTPQEPDADAVPALETDLDEALLGDPDERPELEVQAEFTQPGFDPEDLQAARTDSGLLEEEDAAIDLDALERVLAEDEDGLLAEDPLSSPTIEDERRQGRRSRAAVPARLATSDFHLDGHTRDLSESGVLISADASELPLGKSVTLRLRSPSTGDHIEVTGRVSRHVEAEGTVAAVGVQFEAGGDQECEIAEFVSEVRRSAADRRERGISGVIEELGMPNLVQMLGNTSPAGTLIASHGAEEGVIAFEGAALRYARLGMLRGTKALARMLAWEQGHFEFYSTVDPLDDEGPPQPFDAALLEAMRQIDERARVDSSDLEMATTFRVERGLQAAEPEPSKIDDAVLDLSEAGFTLRRIIDVIPEPDVDILSAVHAFVDLGVLVPE